MNLHGGRREHRIPHARSCRARVVGPAPSPPTSLPSCSGERPDTSRSGGSVSSPTHFQQQAGRQTLREPSLPAARASPGPHGKGMRPARRGPGDGKSQGRHPAAVSTGHRLLRPFKLSSRCSASTSETWGVRLPSSGRSLSHLCCQCCCPGLAPVMSLKWEAEPS